MLDKKCLCVSARLITQKVRFAHRMEQKFYYFGYGSNMLMKRIHIQNPTAIRIGAGKLENYRLDFYTSSKTWLGAPATIVPHTGAHVYGAIWEIDNSNLKDLDNQEGVHEGIYSAINVSILATNSKQPINCRAYHLVNQPAQDLHKISADAIPYDRQPSKTYLKTLVKGAIETEIDENYVLWLRSLRHNGKMVDALEERLELQAVKL